MKGFWVFCVLVLASVVLLSCGMQMLVPVS